MKRRVKTGSKFVIILSMAVICLSACGTTEPMPIEGVEDLGNVPGMVKVETQTQEHTTESDTQETAVKESEPEETVVQDIANPEKPVEYDVETKLSQAEETAAAMEKILQEDASLNQADMNDLSHEIYMVWDDTLNDLWQALKESLDEETMNGLLEEQRAWITEKEEEVKNAGEAVGGGSMASLVCNQRAAKLTQTRVYELASYLGYVGSNQESGNSSEHVEEIPYEEKKTTITFMVEGMEEEVPAIVFEGLNYTISIPEEGWEMIARECWSSDVNGEVQFWITDYAGEDVDIVCGKLADVGYVESETEPYFLSYEDEEALVHNVKLFAEDEKTVGIFYCYPAEAEEGFGVRLRTIIDTFTWISK